MKIFEALKHLITYTIIDKEYHEAFEFLQDKKLNQSDLDFLKQCFNQIDFSSSILSVDVLSSIVKTFNTRFGEIRRAENVIFVMGNTGSGKSTLIHYLNGIPLIRATKEDGCVQLSATKMFVGAEIGHDAQTECVFPAIVKTHQFTFVECPSAETTFTDSAHADFSRFALQRAMSIADVCAAIMIIPPDKITNNMMAESASLSSLEKIYAERKKQDLPILFVISKSKTLSRAWRQNLSSSAKQRIEDMNLYSHKADHFISFLTKISQERNTVYIFKGFPEKSDDKKILLEALAKLIKLNNEMQKRLPSRVDSRTSQPTGTDSESKPMSIPHDSTSDITRSLAKLVMQDNKIVISIIGNTGSGKSTLINYMLGFEMKSGRHYGKPTIDIEGRPGAEIGHEINESQTAQIIEYDLPDSNVSFCDYPGFGNTFHINVELRLETEKTRNAIIIVFSFGDADVLLSRTLEDLGKLFHSTPDALSAPILVVFTKNSHLGPSQMTEEDVFLVLSNGLKKLTDDFSIKLLNAVNNQSNIICIDHLDNRSKVKINSWIEKTIPRKIMSATSSDEAKEEPKKVQPEKTTEVRPTESSVMTHPPQVDSSARRMTMNMSSGVS